MMGRQLFLGESEMLPEGRAGKARPEWERGESGAVRAEYPFSCLSCREGRQEELVEGCMGAEHAGDSSQDPKPLL